MVRGRRRRRRGVWSSQVITAGVATDVRAEQLVQGSERETRGLVAGGNDGADGEGVQVLEAALVVGRVVVGVAERSQVVLDCVECNLPSAVEVGDWCSRARGEGDDEVVERHQ